jgi:hypothetical protein
MTVLARRGLLLAALPFVGAVRAQSGLWPEWLGSYSGAMRFHGSIPLEDIYPPPEHPHVDPDDRAPFGVYLTLRSEDGGTALWLRIDGGPMQTSEHGETLRFGLLNAGLAQLVSAQAKPAPRTAMLTVRPDAVGTEALFNHADGSFWRRHFNLRFTPAGGDVIVWVFDAAGTRARTWRGSVVKRP